MNIEMSVKSFSFYKVSSTTKVKKTKVVNDPLDQYTVRMVVIFSPYFEFLGRTNGKPVWK